MIRCLFLKFVAKIAICGWIHKYFLLNFTLVSEILSKIPSLKSFFTLFHKMYVQMTYSVVSCFFFMHWYPVPSKQCVQILHLGSPIAWTRFSILLNLSVVMPSLFDISSTIRWYSGESEVEYRSRFLSASPSKSCMMRLVSSSMSLLELVKLMNGHP